MAFTDFLGGYAANRMQGVQDRVNQFTGLMSGDEDALRQQFGLETEEERKRRLEREAMLQQQKEMAEAVKPPADTVVSTTKVDTYGDGSQTRTVKTEVPAPAAEPEAAEAPPAQPMVTPPAAMAPPAPQVQPQAQPQAMQQAPVQRPPQPQPMAAQPAAPVAPVAPVQPQPMAQLGTPPVAGPGVQVAGAPGAPMPQMQPPAAPAVPAAPAPAVQAAPAAEPAAAPQPAWMNAANEAGADIDKLLDVATRFPEARPALKEKMRVALENQRKSDEAQQIVLAAATGDPKAQNKLQQALRPERGRAREEVTTSDYIKAYLYSRLGLNELAADAQRKILGKQTKFGQMTLDGSRWQVETDNQGNIVAAKDDEGTQATESTLNKLRAAGMAVTTAAPASATATRIRDSKGKEWSQVPTPQGMRFYDNEGKPGVPQGRTVPIAVGSDLEIAQAREDMQTIAAFSRMSAQQRLDAYANTNKLRADRGLPQLSLQEMGLNTDGSLVGEAVRRPGQPAPAAQPAAMTPPAAQPAPAAQPTPAAQPAASPAPSAPIAPTAMAQPAPAAPAAGPVIPTPQAARPPAAAPAGQIPTAQQMAEQSKESDLNRTLREASARAKISVAQNLEEQKNKIRTTMPASQSNVNRVLTTLNDIATHPGLDKTVGLPKLLSTPLSSIPATDMRDFAAKFKQLGGQEFLAAYNELRGGGGISETEGQKAEQAISALKDTGISPKEFRKNMWILQDAIKQGFDRQRELVGLPPMYRESPQREEAKAWLRMNPNHPKAEQVRRTLSGF